MTPKVHWQDGADRVISVAGADYAPMFLRGICGQGPRLTRDRSSVSCRTCLDRIEQTPEDRKRVYEDTRRRQVLRLRAQRIVIDRHAAEVERELAVLLSGGAA